VVILKSIKEIIAKIRMRPKPVSKRVSSVNGFKVLSTQNFGIKRFFASSEKFMNLHSKEVSQAAHLIAANLKRLKAGEVVESKGFVIKSGYTGKSHSGQNTTLSWSVSHNGKVCFVKMGAHCGEKHFEGYKRAEEFLKKHNNQLFGYKVELVPSHLFYSKSNSKEDTFRGFLVSDFFSADKVNLVSDIECSMGSRAFVKTPLAKAVFRISSRLFSESKVVDADTINCFVDKSNKTLYFFDVYVTNKNLNN